MIDRDSTAGSKWKSAGFIPHFPHNTVPERATAHNTFRLHQTQAAHGSPAG